MLLARAQRWLKQRQERGWWLVPGGDSCYPVSESAVTGADRSRRLEPGRVRGGMDEPGLGSRREQGCGSGDGVAQAEEGKGARR